jgi:hypothetical protein
VPVPDYYTLQLRTDCEPYRGCPSTPEAGQATCEPVEWLADRLARSEHWPVSVLEEGQKPCDAGVAIRSLNWLQDQLRRAGVIGPDESLQVSASIDTEAFRLAVLDRETDMTVGFIELDASGGFPGGVVRIDTEGNESTRGRLRGDLSWEVVAP